MKPKFRHSVIVPSVTLALCSAPVMQAAPLSWDGAANGVWGTAANWNPDAVPAAADDLTIFGPLNAPGALTISVEAAAAANSLNFTNTAATTLTTGGSDQTLTLLGGGLATGTGAVTVGANLPGQAVNIALAASQTWNVRSGGVTLTGTLSDGGTGFSLTKTGAGNLTLSPVAANTFTGGLALNGGTTTLSFANLATPVNLVAPANALTFGGGTLSIIGNGLGTTSQTLGNATVGFSGGGLLVNPNGGTGTEVRLGSLSTTASGGSFVVGSALSPGAGTLSISTTTNKDATGIYGGRVVFANGTANTGYEWATTATAVPGPYEISAYTGYTALDLSAGTDVLNSQLTAGAILTGSRTTNSLKFAPTATATLDIGAGNVLTLTSGGLLMTGNTVNNVNINNGSITAGNGLGPADLVIHQYNPAQQLTVGVTGTNLGNTPDIASSIVNNGEQPVTLVKNGLGSIRFTGTNTFTGGIVVNQGSVDFGINALNNNPITFNANAFFYTNGAHVTTGGITLNNGSQVTICNNNVSFTVTGNVTGTGGISVAQGGQGAITLNLNSPASNAGGNTFPGPIRFEATNNTVFATVNVGSLVDPVGAGNIIFGAAGTSTAHNFGISSTADAPITLNNRQFILAGANPNQSINNESSQDLTINTNPQVTGTTAKNLTLGGAGGGISTMAGSIGNSPTPTAPGTARGANRTTAAVGSITLASVEGIAVGSTITGGTVVAGTTITAINPVTRVVTLSAITTGGVAVGTVYTIADAVNSVSLTKAGAGTWTLSASNTYTGGTGITGGTLNLGHATNTLSDTGGVAVSAGTLALGQNSDTVGAVTLIGGSITGTSGVLTGSSYEVRAGTISAILGGSGALTKTTTGVVTLSAENTYTGVTAIIGGASGGGGLVVTANNALGSTAGHTTVAQSTSLGLSGNLVYSTSETVTGFGTGTNPLSGVFAVAQRGMVQSVSGNNTFAGPIRINAAGSTRFGTQDGASLTLSGPITMADGTTGVTVLFRAGNLDGDFVTLTNSGNSWDTATQIFSGNAGTGAGVRLGAANALSTTAPLTAFINAGTGTTLDLAGFNQQVAGLSNTGVNANLRITNSLAASTSILALNNVSDLDSGPTVVIENGAGLTRVVKAGAFTQTLSGLNTYSAGTTVDAGTLTLGSATALGTGAATVSGGSLNLGGQIIANDVSTGAGGTLTGSGSTGAVTLAGSLTPGGSSIGLITVASATVASTSGMALQLAAAGTRGTDYDALTVSGPLALDGTITVTLNGLIPAAGQSFDLIDCTGPINLTNFTLAADLVLPSLSGGLSWDTTAFASSGVISIVSGGASPYATWSGGAAFDADANNDGVSNGLAFLLGAANVNENATGRLPSVSQSGGNLTMTFSMLNAASRGAAVLSLQHSSDLGSADPWTTVTVPGVSGGPAGGVTFVITPGSPLDRVVATISSSEATAGKLSGRLRGQNP